MNAVVAQDLERARERLSRASPGQEGKVLETLLTEFVWNRLDRYELIATLHERSHRSPAIAAFHEQAHRRYADYLGRAIERCPVPPAERELVVETLYGAMPALAPGALAQLGLLGLLACFRHPVLTGEAVNGSEEGS